MKKAMAKLSWVLVAVAGAWAYATLAFHRGEPLNSAYILIAALCTYAIGYRFYSKWMATRVLMLDDRRATPCEVHDDGKDFVKTNKWIVFGHHFAAISGPGPLVGPVLAAQFGYLPGTLWILIGVVLGGAVQDFVILFCSIRRDGKSLAQMIKEELGTAAGAVAVVAVLAILIILLAVLALVVVNALGESPWGVFTVGATIPIAMFMGGYLRFWRVGKSWRSRSLASCCLLLAVWGGQYVIISRSWRGCSGGRQHAGVGDHFLRPGGQCAAGVAAAGAAGLPEHVHEARDDLRAGARDVDRAAGPARCRPSPGSWTARDRSCRGRCFRSASSRLPAARSPASTRSSPAASRRRSSPAKSYARPVGYGAMCLESLVAIMAMIAACTLQPGVYLSMNVEGEAGRNRSPKSSAQGLPGDRRSDDDWPRKWARRPCSGGPAGR